MLMVKCSWWSMHFLLLFVCVFAIVRSRKKFDFTFSMQAHLYPIIFHILTFFIKD